MGLILPSAIPVAFSLVINLPDCQGNTRENWKKVINTTSADYLVPEQTTPERKCLSASPPNVFRPRHAEGMTLRKTGSGKSHERGLVVAIA